MGGGRLIKAREHHFFTLENDHYIFNVEDIRVVKCSRLEGRILEAAGKEGCTEDKLLTTLGTEDPERIRAGIDRLAAAGLLYEGKPSAVVCRPAETSCYTIMVNVSQTCNLACSYCYTHSGYFDYAEQPEEAMNPQTARSLIDFVFSHFQDARKITFHFYGGEPLLNYKCIELLVHEVNARRRNGKPETEFALTTNGTLINKEIAGFFDLHRFTVFYSIDGPQPIHDQYRRTSEGRGCFDRVSKNLQLLLSFPNIFVIGSSVIRRGWGLAEAEAFLTSLGVHQFKAEKVWLEHCDSINLTATEREKYIRDIRGHYAHYIEAVEQFRRPLDYRLNAKLLQLLEGVRRCHFCLAGQKTFGISASGEIYPCSLHVGRPQSCLGNLNEGIDSHLAHAFQEKFDVRNAAECQYCWARYLCGGGCSAMVDRFGRTDCDVIHAETETAIAIFQTIRERDPLLLLNLVAPDFAKWAAGIT